MLPKFLTQIFGSRNDRLLKSYRKVVQQVNALEPAFEQLDDAQLRAKTDEFRQRLASGTTLDALLPEAFAAVREAGKRTLKMRHFDVQLMGGMALHQGKIAEMRTGEGKTLVATLPVYLNALAGQGVHVVTVNDYLARRDAEWMGRLYGFLGLTVGVNVPGMTREEKQAAFAADVTYGTNNEFGFDYLRDNMVHEVAERVMARGQQYAIVDEVDSILIDEARTPLIISGQAEDHTELYVSIDAVVPQLKKQIGEADPRTGEGVLEPGDFTVDEKQHQVFLTDAGHEHAEQLLTAAGLLAEGASLYDPANITLMHHVYAALRARHLYHRDQHYVVQNGEIIIVDEFTGRLMTGRRWSDGLHQAVEAKERVQIQNENQTLASVTFQNYFRLYRKLGGMTGTADTEAYEFQEIYGLETVVIPPNKPTVRKDELDLVYKTTKEKHDAVTADIRECHGRGQPVLVGTTSIENSELVSALLTKAGLPHQVLNAKQHAREAEIVAQAGRPGMITIATNMAGRGTDIVLGGNVEKQVQLLEADASLSDEARSARAQQLHDEWQGLHEQVKAQGGLRIIATERHESRRIDNQLRGRSGRQGDPGSSRFYLSLDDSLMRIFAGDRVKTLMDRMGMPDDEPIVHPWVTKSIGDAQGKVEARNFDMRKHLLEYDEVMSQQRRTIYRIRRELLDGTYAPEIMGEDGKPTGKLRKVAIHEAIRADIARHLAAVLLPHCGGKGADGAAKAPESLAEATRVVNDEGLVEDVYQTWGRRVALRSGESVKDLHDRLVDELAFSLSQQRDRLLDLIDAVVGSIVEECAKPHVQSDDWDWKGIRAGFFEHFGIKAEVDPESVTEREALVRALYKQAETLVFGRERDMGPELLLRVFRHYYLEEIDRGWVDHLSNMEHLRDGIGLRGYGQKDPKQEYKKEGYDLFMTLTAAISSAVVSKLFRVRVEQPRDIEAIEAEDARRHEQRERQMLLQHGGDVVEGEEPAAPAPALRRPPEAKIVTPPKPAIERNDACPCGSGQLFRKCHGAILEDEGNA